LSLAPSITFRHPYTSFAESCVPLSVSRIDSLFKSDAFRVTSAPLFDVRNVETALDMRAVFPQSEEEPCFLNALLYSIIQIANRGAPTIEGLSLLGKSISLLNKELSSLPQNLSPAVVGAIMILKTTAYKTRDAFALDTHTRGLKKALDYITKGGNSLTLDAKRATFWLDLYGAELAKSKPRISHLAVPGKVKWQRQRYPELISSLPLGFFRQLNYLPEGLPECISDIIELQEFLRIEDIAQTPHYIKYHQIDTMQASIGSRLALLAQSSVKLGLVSEAARLGIFICCYCTWMETWGDTLTLCRVAEKLLDLVEPTILPDPKQLDSVWLQHMDLLLWLLLILSCIVDLDYGSVEGLRSRLSCLIASVYSTQHKLSCHSITGLSPALRNALQDFIYVDGWLSRRCYIKDWFALELSINASNN
jgi:hypothetical protein